MDEFDLLSAVQPQEGWYAVVGIKGDSRHQELVETRDELEDWVTHFLRQKRNVFFGIARFKDGESRKKDNVRALRSFWLDVDCGEGKDYPTQEEGLNALKDFCKTTGLPRPLIVNSGRGLHVYWPLNEDITREQWEPTATRLREVCQAQEFSVDNSCFEVARILRVPGTFNYKGDEPLPVEMLNSKAQALSYAEFSAAIGAKPAEKKAPASGRGLSPLAKQIQDNVESSFGKIMRRGECEQLNSCYAERETLSEPRWFNALSIAKFCKDRTEAIHKLSADHPDYDEGQTEQKIAHIVGPHTCAEFEKNNPKGCDACPHLGKIKSPIVLGREIAAAEVEDSLVEVAKNGIVETYIIPEYPFPYFRAKGGGIALKQTLDGKEAEDVVIYDRDLYVVKRMQDPTEGGVTMLRHHTIADGVDEFVVPNHKVMDGAELRKILAARNIMTPKKQYDFIVDCIIKSVNALRVKELEHMRNQFGWVDNDSKFIVGDREISVEGTFHSPPSSVTKVISEYMAPAGSFEKWKEVFDLYGAPGLEAHAFAAATAFGAPLLRFSGQRGAIINVIHPNSGTGKTTILHMCNSVWGDPQRLCAKKDDTFNSKVFKVGVHCNLPICFDEMSNTEPKQLSELAYLITQGTGKDRMRASSNELRVNLTSWQTIALCSSNHSFYEKLEELKNSPQGEMMRIIEITLDYANAIDTETGKEMFDHQLLENYGYAGDIYARYLVENYDEVKALYASIQSSIDKLLKLTQRERFWSATAAANITGIHIAIRLGLCSWDLKRIFRWTCKMLLGLRNTLTPIEDPEMQTLGDFIVAHVANVLVVEDGIDRRNGMSALPPLEPKQELMIRFEPDTKKIFITAKAFRKYCSARSIGYRETINRMKKDGIFLGSGLKRMTKGMKFNAPPVQALVFDGSGPDFDGLANLIPDEEPAEA